MKITFLIGNGFDIAFTRKNSLSTSYSNLFDFFSKYGITVNELKSNDCVVYLKMGDFENLLVEKYKSINTPEELFKFYNDKDELCAFICEKFKLWQNDALGYLNTREAEFEESITGFYNRMEPANQNTLIGFLNNKISPDESITVDFITFNGTNVLEKLVDNLRQKSLKVSIENIDYDLLIGNVYYVHSSVDNRYSNYHRMAFGTTVEEDIQSNTIQLDSQKRVTLPKSIHEPLLKTNYDFEKWIKDSDLLISHGLSFGHADKRYWNIISECLNSGAVLLDCDFRHSGLFNIPAQNNEIIKRKSNFATHVQNRIIVDMNPGFKPGKETSIIFSFS